MKKRRMLGPLLVGTLTTSLTSAQNALISMSNSTNLHNHQQPVIKKGEITGGQGEITGGQGNSLKPGEVFLILSPIVVVVIMGLVLVGIVLKNKGSVRRQERKGPYLEFVDIENVTENVELMVQNREGFS